MTWWNIGVVFGYPNIIVTAGVACVDAVVIIGSATSISNTARSPTPIHFIAKRLEQLYIGDFLGKDV